MLRAFHNLDKEPLKIIFFNDFLLILTIFTTCSMKKKINIIKKLVEISSNYYDK